MKYVFVSYVHEDREVVDKLCADLRARDIPTWLDRDQIFPGEPWQHAIRSAIRDGSFFLACFSNAYHTKDDSYMNEELALAIEELRRKPQGRIWFIPALLSPCKPPSFQIRAGESLDSLQWVALHEDWDRGVDMIVRSVSALRLTNVENVHPDRAVEPSQSGAPDPSFTLSQISRAAIGLIMSRNPSTIHATTAGDEIRLSYVRENDQTEWKYKCKLDGDRILWAANPGGRWRNHPLDEKIYYRVLPGGFLEIEEYFSDGSSHKENYTQQQLR